MARARKIKGIDCDAPVAEAVGLVLMTRVKEMCSRRDRALDWTDPEGVHDMRVSSRRLRGALSDFEPYVGKRGLREAVKQVKSVADALGEVRDQDVAIIGLEKLAAHAPDTAKATLDQLVDARKTIRQKARKDLQLALRRIPLKQMQSAFGEAISAAIKGSRKRSKKNSDLTYGSMARLIINERLEELEDLSSGFYHPLNVKPLHKMRIAAKRLRYALELFNQCLGPEAAIFAKRVARLQTSLGELHDCDIWIETFGVQHETALKDDSDARDPGSLWLLSHFVRLHSKHLRDALARWEEWESSHFSDQLRGLLNSNSETEPKGES